MLFRVFESEVEGLIASAARALEYPEESIDVVPPPDPSYGDLASAVALKIAKTIKERPGTVALKLSGQIMLHPEKFAYVSSVSAHASGYLNFQLSFPKFAQASMIEALESDRLGASDVGQGRRVAIEHTNVNPNKALHIGHARNLVLGDSLVRVMKHLGFEVQTLNYIDDSGAQVADIIVGFRYLGISDEAPPNTKFDAYCGDQVYVRVTQEYLKDPALKSKQSLVLREIEKGEGDVAEYASRIVDKILASQLATCWRLGASYDLLNWESHIVHSGMWASLFEKLKAKGMVNLETDGENKGCWVIPDPDTGEQKVLVRSDGTAVYIAKDIPYAAWKIGLVGDPFGYRLYANSQPSGEPLWTTARSGEEGHPKFGGADLAISVIDTRQSYLQRIVTKVLEGLGPGSAKRYLHRSYEVVSLSKNAASALGVEMEGDFVHMSGRKGLYVNVDTALEALKRKANEETRKRNPGEPEDWVAGVSEAIAVAALRYVLVNQDPDKMIVFDLEEALKFEGDTGPYLLYTYARGRRILEKSGSAPRLSPGGVSKLIRHLEKNLVKKLSMLDKAVIAAGEYYSPKEVCRYSHELAVSFNEFYEKVPVNRETDQELRDARLVLVDAATRVLAQSMRILGIPVLEKI